MRLTSNELAAGRNSYNAVVLYSIYWLFKGVHAVVNLSVLSQHEAGVRVTKAARVSTFSSDFTMLLLIEMISNR